MQVFRLNKVIHLCKNDISPVLYADHHLLGGEVLGTCPMDVRVLISAILLAVVLSPTSAFGVADERRKPKEPSVPKPVEPEAEETTPQKGDERVLVKTLDGVRFVSDAKDVVAEELELLGVDTAGVPLLDSDEFRSKLKPFLGKPVSRASIKRMALVAIKHCHQKGRPFVKVIVPEQDITTRVIHFVVKESRLGEIRVEGNKYRSSERYLKVVQRRADGTIDQKRLLRDLNRFNENAFRRMRPYFVAGKEPDTTDLLLKAEERFPVRFFGGYEDTGARTTGLDRLLVGFNWGDGFFQDHEIGYQYTTDIDFERLQSHSGYWRIPLPNHDKLAFFGGYSETRATISEELVSPAVNWQVSMRYLMPLKDLGKYSHQLDLGFDFKQTENNLEFGGLDVYSSSVDTAQFALQYSGGTSDRWGTTDFSVAGFFSPGHFTTHQRTPDYNNARAGTDPQYVYGTVDLERTWDLPKGMSVAHRIHAQFSTDRLQSTEQLLLGGVNSVRGYDDRLVAADEGVQINLELRSPDFMLGRIQGDDQYENRLQFVLFYDYGWGRNKGRYAGEAKNMYLNSVGAGVRYRLGTHVSARFDYGRLLHSLKGGLVGSDHGRIHLGVVVGF